MLTPAKKRNVTKDVVLKDIKWSNKYECPSGYNFNDDGYVITDLPYPKMGVSIQPWQLRVLSPETLFTYNLLVLMLLNPDNDLGSLGEALSGNMYNNTKIHFGNKAIDFAISRVKEITNLEDVKGIPRYILHFTNIWYSKDSSIKSVRDIVRIRENETIDIVRDMMPIHGRWKTKQVSEYSEYSTYKIRNYWRERGFSTTDRSIAAIMEANDFLIRDSGISKPTQVQLAEASGLSRMSLRNNITLVRDLLEANKTKQLMLNSHEDTKDNNKDEG